MYICENRRYIEDWKAVFNEERARWMFAQNTLTQFSLQVGCSLLEAVVDCQTDTILR